MEAAPDSLPDTIFTPRGTFDDTGTSVSASLTRWEHIFTEEIEKRIILRYNAPEETLPKFYRGNIESSQSGGPEVTTYNGQDQASFSYYGAARILNERLVRVEEEQARPTGEVFHPTRESVEARPDLRGASGRSLELDGLKTRFMTEHGQEFRVSRPHGHSVSYDTYQGDHYLCLSFNLTFLSPFFYLQLSQYIYAHNNNLNQINLPKFRCNLYQSNA